MTNNAKVAIITPDLAGPVKNGGVGTFVTHWARLLRQHNHPVTVVYSGPLDVAPARWLPEYERMGVKVLYRTSQRPAEPPLTGARAAAALLPPDAEIVYSQDMLASAFYAIRARRFRSQQMPVFVNVLHSSSMWIRDGMQRLPVNLDDDLRVDFAERYVNAHSDYVVSPSQYMLGWARSHGWPFPPDDRVRVLGYPFRPRAADHNPPTPAPAFRRLVFFGRLETRKGLELFVEAVTLLKSRGALAGLDEIVFLGKMGEHTYDDLAGLQAQFAVWDVPVSVLSDLDSFESQAYLAEHVADSLVVMPSLVDNFPFAAIEASLIPGLNFICAANSGVPEMMGVAGRSQLFQPHVNDLAAALTSWLAHGPRSDAELGRYDYAAANQRWLDFHDEVRAHARRIQAAPAPPPARPRVDVVVSHYNLGKYLPQLLDSLAEQTYSDFAVFVVDDASTDAASSAAFAQAESVYTGKGWHFIRAETNAGLSATRNRGAALGGGDYLIFMDADNIARPEMIARFTEAITTSGDDCLTSHAQVFEGDGAPRRLLEIYEPLGSAPELGMFMNVFGDANFIIRRAVFEALGGFSQHYPPHISGEDYELLARLALSGYRLDVIPETLFYYRYRPQSLVRASSQYLNTMRVQAVYREALQRVGLGHLIPALLGLYVRAQGQPLIDHNAHHNPQWVANHIPWYVLRDAIIAKIRKHLPRR